ncbi:hypothetical protein CHGG_00486 [Chaetomium globosum CBS 148.51]|uniref:HTH psq-type domain-containing protein n=1 Tax=Chaetomium globosum (strain ATCC 6205 / CBS 148.51 / DSM 1962 / NBRC 6347 / NRRL 1970) TaxID=306901 RepID=Q2HH18_CHAGB|nr:uncharacterized protein CHGG_00486 [Chaetomium globosum CBS 148.51]EAQ92251.1 hypothetical protein CHGG_00486 [Chaetomium globosum CBS 148.51]
MTDCAPIGKRLFLRRYAQAKNDAIKERNIRSGWKASGLWPVNLDKPPDEPSTVEPNQPVSQSASQSVSQSVSRRLIKTPNRSQEVHRLISTNVRLRRLQTIDPVARSLFKKVGKSLDNTAIKVASQEQKIRALEAEVDRLRPRKRKKVRMDPNTRFAQIEQIMQAKKALAKQLELSEKLPRTLEALRSGQIKSIRKAAAAFDVPNRILQERVKGVLHVNKRKSRVESYSRPKNLP